jgi:tyrosine-protein kinase Etk/Wzc
MEVLKIFEMLLRRKGIIIFTFFSVFLAVLICGKLITPTYESRAKILIERSDSLSSLMSALGLVQEGKGEKQKANVATNVTSPYETEIVLTTLRPLLEKVISKFNLRDRNANRMKPHDLINPSKLVLLMPEPTIKVEQYEDSDILEIISTSNDPVEAANMSNELAKLYIEDRLNQTREEFKAARMFIENQIKAVKKEYIDSLLARKDFMIEEKTVDLQTEIKNQLGYILDLKKEYTNNEIMVEQAIENIKLIENKIAGKEYVTVSLIEQLESTLNNLLITISGKQIDFTAEHQDIASLNRKVDTVKRMLADEASVVFKNEEVALAPIYDELLKELMNSFINKKIGETKRKLLSKYIDSAQDELIQIPLKTFKSAEIEMLLAVNRDVYKKLLKYQTQAGIAESMTLYEDKLIEPAVASDRDDPLFPKTDMTYLFALCFALFWSFTLACFMEYIDNTIKTPEDLKEYELSFLGSIPKSTKKVLILSKDANDPLYESYRIILSGIRFAQGERPSNKKLLITSCNPKEGTSTVLANLGILYATEGNKVLLVDTDLRRPSLHELFGLTNEKGLSNLLLETSAGDGIIQESNVGGLSILPSGSAPPDTGLLLKSKKMRDLVKKLEEKYDIILFDSAPLLIKNDAVLLMDYLDDIVLVLNSGISTHQTVSRSTEILQRAKINPLGIILNCVKK